MNMPTSVETTEVSIKVKGGGSVWNFKKCPRCQGDTFIDEDTDRSYEKCLQCGYERELERVRVSRKTQDTGKENTGVF
jgi:ribosomal protein S27AE